MADANARFALTTGRLLQQLEPLIASDRNLGRLRWQAVDEIESRRAENWQAPPLQGDSLAFLQYTSGSTGVPKGVAISHGNLLHNQLAISRAFEQTRSDMVMAGWLPLHHDMGLIGNALHTLWMGGTYVFLSPLDFVRKPIRWLRLISQRRATIAGAPNFAYEMCIRETTEEMREGLDLSSWSCAFNGAEPVRQATLDGFCREFEPYGFQSQAFCPCFGMAETTLLLAGKRPSESLQRTYFDGASLKAGEALAVAPDHARAEALVACGKPDPDMPTRIVDPQTGVACPPGSIGEIWTRGPSVAHGYWNKPDLTTETFAAKLTGEPAGPGYLRTGDLGFLHHDHLYVTGRIKDLIIVGGANHYPHDIEATVESCDDGFVPQGCAAFGVDSPDGERLVIVAELQRSHVRHTDHDKVFASVLEAVSAEHQLSIGAIVLVRPGAVPKTTSGKTRRSEAARMFRDQEYKVVAFWEATRRDLPPGDDVQKSDRFTTSDQSAGLPEDQQRQIDRLEQWLLRRLEKHVHPPQTQLDRKRPLAWYGIGSLAAVRIADELSEHLRRPISPTIAFDHPTIEALAHFLVSGEVLRGLGEARTGNSDEPLAVVGMACRFPGAEDLQRFWDRLRRGEDCTRPLRERYHDLGMAAEQASRLGTLSAGLLDDVDQFDAQHFMVHAHEADEMDPQQRILLETSWHALEDAGIPADSLAGSSTGVFVGLAAHDYLTLQTSRGLPPTAYRATGNSPAVAANRLSYTFDLCGPSLVIDTACSSSLVAVDQARQALQTGACDLAVVGAVNLILDPDTTRCFLDAGMLSPSGVSRTFAADADGYVRGEGCGVVILKRLSDARAAADRIYCLVRGSAVNQDGKSLGLTAPSGVAQQEVIRQALSNASVSAASVDYVEAHGTGTSLGDTVEMSALTTVFSDRLPNPNDALVAPQDGSSALPRPLRVGSVKTNLGHLEAAAGMAGLIKVCLSFQHDAIPAHLNFDRPNPKIDWNGTIEIPTVQTAWPRRGQRPRIAGVSSFGFGGTNAHVILSDPPAGDEADSPSEEGETQPVATESPGRLLAVSAKSESALRGLATRYAVALQARRSSESFRDFCHTANARRQHFRHRLSVTAHNATECAAALNAWAIGEEDCLTIAGEAAKQVSLCWMFSGQGGNSFGVGKSLYEREPTFRQALNRYDRILQRYWPTPLQTILWEDETCWNRVDVQPAIVCFQLALADLWKSWGVQPSAVIGHSLGEYSAACVAGVLSSEAAIKLVCRRATLVQTLAPPGAMLAVLADEENVRSQLQTAATAKAGVDIAALNGPRQTVVAGDRETLASLRNVFRESGLRSVWLESTHGFHSPLMDPILDPFAEAVEEIHWHVPHTKYLSSVLGGWASEQLLSPDYWRANLRDPVQFYPAITKLAPETVCLEIGPGRVLQSLLKTADVTLTSVSSLQASPQEQASVLHALGQLYVAGVDPDWPAVTGERCQVVSLPSYPMQRKRHWFDQPTAPARSLEACSQGCDSGSPRHPLVGRRLDLPTEERVFPLALADADFLTDHQVGSSIVLPASAYLEIASHVGSELLGGPVAISELQISLPLSKSERGWPAAQLIAKPTQPGWECRLLSRAANDWACHASWSVRREDRSLTTRHIEIESGSEQSVADHYATCERAGLRYGPSFRGLQRLFCDGQKACCEVMVPAEEGRTESRYQIHPGTLDSCLQVVAGFLSDSARDAFLPTSVESYRCCRAVRAGEKLLVEARWIPNKDAHLLAVDLQINDARQQPIAAIGQLVLKSTHGRSTQALGFHEQWIPQIRALETGPVLAGSTQDRIVTSVLAKREPLADETGLNEHRAALQELEALGRLWVVRLFRELGVRFDPGDRFASHDLAQRLKIPPAHRRLLERFCEMLAEEGVLQHLTGDTENDWRVVASLPDRCPQLHGRNLLAAHPRARIEVQLLERCGMALAAVMREEVEPLSLLFPADDTFSAGSIYRDSPGAQSVNALVAEAMGEVQSCLEPGRGLRVLEVGAGTGATTRAILKKLDPARSTYTFTDVSPALLSSAESAFADDERMDFRLLDVERDPQEQDFETACYDVVVAANVIHATRDLRTSLRHLTGLLAAGGILIVVEGTRKVGWLDLTFGLTPGWWRFADTDLRPNYPLADSATWLDLLAESGYSHRSIVQPFEPTANELDPANAVIIATRDSEALTVEPSDDRVAVRKWLLVGGTPDLKESLSSSLQSRERACQVSETSVTSEVGSDSLASATDVVFLGALDLQEQDSSGSLITIAHRLNQQLLELTQAMLRAVAECPDKPRRLWVVVRGDHASADDTDWMGRSLIGGWIRTLRLEQPDFPCRSVELDPKSSADSAIGMLVDELLAGIENAESEVAFRGDLRLVRRLKPATLEAERSRSWQLERRGSIEGLRFSETPLRKPGPAEVTVDVRASGVNFRDVLNVLGLYPERVPLGAECAGIITAVGPDVTGFQLGQRVVFFSANSFAERVTVPVSCVCTLPHDIDFESAATIPVAFLTASKALEEIAQIGSGSRILVHAASGGVGLACLQLAAAAGAQVFATASRGKHEYLRRLGVQHVFDSRSSGFAKQLHEATGGEGVHVVVNTLGEEFLEESLRCLVANGTFVELTKPQPGIEERVARIDPQVRFAQFDLMHCLRDEPTSYRTHLQSLLQRIESGQLTPLPYTDYPMEDAPTALRTLRDASHTGKIVLARQTRNGDSARVSQAPSANAAGSNTPVLARNDRSYLIAGGLSDLGLLVAQWLACNGAGYILLVSRQAAEPEQQRRLDSIRRLTGATIAHAAADLRDRDAVDRAVEQAAKQLPLGGVFQLAGILDNALIQNQTPESLQRVLAPKLDGSWHLHQATLQQPIDQFVLFSSAASALGSPGQVNHAAANAFLDGLAAYRRQRGLPGLTINWGPWSKLGSAKAIGRSGVLAGIGMIDPFAGMAFFQDQMVAQATGSSTSQVIAIDLQADQLKSRADALPMLQSILRTTERAETNGDSISELRDRFLAAPLTARKPLLIRHLQQVVAKTLRLSQPSDVRADEALFDLGLDSLTSLEVRNQIQAALQIELPSTTLFDYPTPADLADHLSELLSQDAPSPPSILAEPAPHSASEEPDGPEPEVEWNGLVDSICQLTDDLTDWADQIEEATE